MPRLFGVDFTDKRIDELEAEIVAYDGSVPECRLIVTANVDHIVNLQRNPALRQAYQFAWVATVDGAPLIWVARAAGVDIPQRITGADLFARVFDKLDAGRHRPAFVVSDADLAERVREWLLQHGFHEEQFSIVVPNFGFEKNPEEAERLLNALTRCKPTHVFFGVGAPKSEIFVTEHRDRLQGAIVMCVGAGIGFRFGTLQRAPTVMRDLGFEWLWRLGSEPTRLFKRYVIESHPFFRLALAEIQKGRRRGLAANPDAKHTP